MSTAQRISERLDRAGITVRSGLAASLAAYFDLLELWNRRLSLTSLNLTSDPTEAIDRLLVEPVAAAPLVPARAAVLDVGSGGGSPAVPMKLATPSTRLRMIESNGKKAAFLREVMRRLEITGAVVENVRLEQVAATPDIAGDVITLRAVRADLETLSGLQPLLRPGGKLLLFRASPLDSAALPAGAYVESTMPLLSEYGSFVAVVRFGNVSRGTR